MAIGAIGILLINYVGPVLAQTAYELREQRGESPYSWESLGSSTTEREQQHQSTTTTSGSSSSMQPPAEKGGIDALITNLKNDGETLKVEIANTNLFKTGSVEDLINKVYYYEGRVSAWGGGTWAYLQDVQDALLAKIKETGQDGFTVSELVSIDSFATNAAQSKIDHPTTNIFE